ncbi:MAG: type II toxin-antitoxin system RelE/ParE family toxin [Bryobacteraceae bacterium]
MPIRWTEPALRDLTGFCDYTEEQDRPEAAHRVAIRIYEAVTALTQFPRRGRGTLWPGANRALASWSFPVCTMRRNGRW